MRLDHSWMLHQTAEVPSWTLQTRPSRSVGLWMAGAARGGAFGFRVGPTGTETTAQEPQSIHEASRRDWHGLKGASCLLLRTSTGWCCRAPPQRSRQLVWMLIYESKNCSTVLKHHCSSVVHLTLCDPSSPWERPQLGLNSLFASFYLKSLFRVSFGTEREKFES